jgi:hypothetical protein
MVRPMIIRPGDHGPADDHGPDRSWSESIMAESIMGKWIMVKSIMGKWIKVKSIMGKWIMVELILIEWIMTALIMAVSIMGQVDHGSMIIPAHDRITC